MAKKRLPIAKASSPTPVGAERSYKQTAEDKARERRWRAEDALRTCEEYERVKSDKQLMGDVKQLAKEKMNKLKKVAG